MISILLFVIMLLEVDLGHRPVLASGHGWLALIPVVWLPLALVSLIAVQIVPSMFTMIAALVVMAVAAAVGMLGSGLHMMAAGVDFDHLSRLFSSAVWGGRVSPNWPVAITLASVLGFIAAVGAHRDGASLPRGAGGATTTLAYILIVVGIAFSAWPALVTVSATSLILAALLLVAVVLAVLVGTEWKGKIL
ncbi:MAG TPA: hypothetical protein VG986_10605 [Pseudolabrys sp.]|nr:hypothetical protein [Pseudolabrys sp.]